MKLLVQRVTKASVSINKHKIATINHGLLVFVSFGVGDTAKILDKAIHKLINLRIFANHNSKFNLSIQDVQGEILVVSQFTLEAKLKGHRPSFSNALEPAKAKLLYLQFVDKLKNTGIPTKSGHFATHMQIKLTNDGPVTIFLKL